MATKTHHFLPNQIHPKTNQFEVLVIDDMAINRVLLNKVFSRAGYAVIEAESAEAAIEMIEAGIVRPDAIVTDVEMPGMNGIEFTEVIRGLGGVVGQIPIVVASGNPDLEMEMESYEAGANVFLSKPFNIAHLREEVADVLKADNDIHVSVSRLQSRTQGINQLKTRLN